MHTPVVIFTLQLQIVRHSPSRGGSRCSFLTQLCDCSFMKWCCATSQAQALEVSSFLFLSLETTLLRIQLPGCADVTHKCPCWKSPSTARPVSEDTPQWQPILVHQSQDRTLPSRGSGCGGALAWPDSRTWRPWAGQQLFYIVVSGPVHHNQTISGSSSSSKWSCVICYIEIAQVTLPL